MKVVIVGAGPAGLYAAIKFKKAGMTDIEIIEQRTPGEYIRPGHLNKNAFTRAENGTSTTLWPGASVAHIKDLERGLYDEATRLNIKISQKKFIDLQQDVENPGVIVVDNNGEQEFIPTKYVFDCTGVKRKVIEAVNRAIPESPLQLITITEPPIKNHFIAYVKIRESEWRRFEQEKQTASFFPAFSDPVAYAKSIIKLRALGWNEFVFPRCYGAVFGKDKVCAYFHAPDGLAKENYDLWVQTVLDCYTTSPIHFEHLPPSKKHPYKAEAQFCAFSVKAQALNRVAYKGENLPTVIGLGDTQSDFDYSLAHGIFDGLDCIDGLFEHLEFYNNEIVYFYEDEYQGTIDDRLKAHKRAVANAANSLQQSFDRALDEAPLKLRRALTNVTDSKEQEDINVVLQEVEARQSYRKAVQHYRQIHTADNLLDARVKSHDLSSRLDQIHNDLLKALVGLPASFEKERHEAQALLASLANSWKEHGNYLFKNKKIIEAIEAYNKALDIYNSSWHPTKLHLKEMTLYSNLAVSYNQLGRYSEAISAANYAKQLYEQYADSTESTALYEKVIFNLINALCSQAQLLLASQNKADAKSLHAQAENLLHKHEGFLSNPSFNNVINTVSALKAQLIENVSRRASEPNIAIIIDTSDELSVDVNSKPAPTEENGVGEVSDSEGTMQIQQSTKTLARLGTFAQKPRQDERKIKNKSTCHCTIL